MPAGIILWLLLGLVLGGGFIALARRFQRFELHLLSSGLIVAALAYPAFAAWGSASSAWLLAEVAGVVFYCLLAWLGLRFSAVWLALGWALHAAWDGGLHLSGTGAGFAPPWYVVPCLSFDLLVAACIALRHPKARSMLL